MLTALVEANAKMGRKVEKEAYMRKVMECDSKMDNPFLRVRWSLILAKDQMAVGDFAAAQASLYPSYWWYKGLLECNFFSEYSKLCRSSMPAAMRTLAKAWKELGKVDEARALKADMDETEAILKSMSDTALLELQTELQQERAATVASRGGAAPAPTSKTKPTRKQQKRKAAQRRKAEGRAAAVVAAAAAGGRGDEGAYFTAAEEEEEGDSEGYLIAAEQEDDKQGAKSGRDVEPLAAATAQLGDQGARAGGGGGVRHLPQRHAGCG